MTLKLLAVYPLLNLIWNLFSSKLFDLFYLSIGKAQVKKCFFTELESGAGNSCYVFMMDQPRSWEDSRIVCSTLGGNLTTAATEREHMAIVGHIYNNLHPRKYIISI